MLTSRRAAAGIGLAAAMWLCLAGCQMGGGRAAPAPSRFDLPPVPDRLRAYYKELQAGRFEILADFEQPEQVQIFRVDGPGRVGLTVRKSRLATGAGALEVRLDDAEAALVVDDRSATEWALPRDWRRFELLMASIFAVEPAVASVQIVSGFEQQVSWTSRPLPLRKGWNLLRVDLADVGRRTDLSDVRQIRLAVKAAGGPARFYLDDLLVADNTTTIFGNPAGDEPALYVIKKGRRLHVGAVGRFELVFSHGLLAGWYDLKADPKKRADLAGMGPLGPALVALDETGRPVGPAGIECWQPLAQAVQTEQRLIGANRLAVTIEGRIQFHATPSDNSSTTGQPGTAGDQTVAEHHYTYTVRADGRIFVGVRCVTHSERFRPRRVGLAVTALAGLFETSKVDMLDRQFGSSHSGVLPAAATQTRPVSAASGPAERIPRALLLRRTAAARSALMLAPHKPTDYEQLITAESRARETAAHIFVLAEGLPTETRLAAMLAVWPPDLGDPATAAAMARDYQEPSAPLVEVGRLRTDSPGDLDGDGFDESEGTWMLEPDGPVLRLRWPAGRLRFWPMFRLGGTAGKACWAYLDGRIVRPIERDRHGQAVFVLPEILSRSTLLEVTIER